MKRVVDILREKVRVVATDYTLHGDLRFSCQVRIRVKGEVGSLQVALAQLFIVALGPRPDPGHGVKHAAFFASLSGGPASTAVPVVPGQLRRDGLDRHGSEDQGNEAGNASDDHT